MVNLPTISISHQQIDLDKLHAERSSFSEQLQKVEVAVPGDNGTYIAGWTGLTPGFSPCPCAKTEVSKYRLGHSLWPAP